MIKICIYGWEHSPENTMFFYTQENTIVDYVDSLDQLRIWL